MAKLSGGMSSSSNTSGPGTGVAKRGCGLRGAFLDVVADMPAADEDTDGDPSTDPGSDMLSVMIIDPGRAEIADDVPNGPVRDAELPGRWFFFGVAPPRRGCRVTRPFPLTLVTGSRGTPAERSCGNAASCENHGASSSSSSWGLRGNGGGAVRVGVGELGARLEAPLVDMEEDKGDAAAIAATSILVASAIEPWLKVESVIVPGSA